MSAEHKVVVELTPEQATALITAAEGGYLNLDDPRPALEALAKLDAGLRSRPMPRRLAT